MDHLGLQPVLSYLTELLATQWFFTGIDWSDPVHAEKDSKYFATRARTKHVSSIFSFGKYKSSD
jgi:hypothetical protein